MKKIMIFAAMAAMFSLASCQKDEVVANNEAKESPMFTASINAGTTKTTVDVSTGKVTWKSTDKITITDASAASAIYKIKSIDGNTGKATFELESGALGDGPYTATYGSAPSTYQTYSATAGTLYMTAPATSNNCFTFTVQCGLMKLNLSKSGETITNIAVTGTPTGGTKKTYTMYCPGGVDISSGKDFFIALPAGSYDKIEVYKYGATNGFEVCSLIPSTSIAVSANHIKPVNASDGKIAFSECQNLPGVFSVSDTKQVYFSKGNLWYGKVEGESQKTWNFEINQSDYQPTSDGSWNEDHISHFFWSKTESVAYAEYYSDGSSDGSDVFFTNDPDNDEKAKIDFTVNGVTGKYRTLSHYEWSYLFDSHKYKRASVSGVEGFVIAPDGFIGDLADTYEDDALAADNLVFLPAAGSRMDSDFVYDVGDYGCYWSSRCEGYDDSAIRIKFDMESINPGAPYMSLRSDGSSIRLVTDVE